ncbi:MAG: DNA repair protein RadA [Oscillospiraceae bacterium]|nr:DNA repair protein RadA [Oscillospiraceae bacterium]
MAKAKSLFVCSACGGESSKWNGRCTFCGEWNTLEEQEYVAPVKSRSSLSVPRPSAAVSSDKIMKLKDIDVNSDIRYSTGLGELNRVLGGGLVKGSIVLLGGEPGIGKSTLLLQICEFMGREYSILYVSGEESTRQIKIRASRLGVDSDNLYLLAMNDAEVICGTISASKPDIVIIDSIQTMVINGVNSSAGSISQVRECTNLFMRTAKSEEIPIFIVGHVNKDGAIAGPKVMEHIVDAVLYFEGERHLSYRILRAVKNRYGSTNEIGVFDMQDKGLVEVENPSLMLLSGRPKGVSGSCIACIMEGSRPIMADIQALVTKSGYAVPRRTATGYDFSRTAIILAVLEKRAGLFYGTLDVYINVVGGIRIDDPAADLAVAMSLYSGLMDIPIDGKLAAFGEIGLGGEVRNVSSITQRLKEAQHIGFERCIVPKLSMRGINPADYKLEIIPVASVRQAFAVIKGN